MLFACQSPINATKYYFVKTIENLLRMVMYETSLNED